MSELTVPLDLIERVRMVLRRDLKLPTDMPLEEDTPLFGGEFDLDSLDALMLVASVEKEFGVKIPNEAVGREILQSVGSLAEYVAQRLASGNTEEREAKGASGGAAPAADVDLDAMLAGLPHGPAFRFITRLVAVTPGERGEAVWELSGREPLFEGHFPGRPVVPGVLIGEAMAQLSGIVGAGASGADGNGAPAGGSKPVVGSISQLDVRFRRMVEPPATIRLTSRLLETRDELYRFEAAAMLADGSVFAEGHVTLRLG